LNAVSGRPAYLFDINNVDWLPNRNLGYDFSTDLVAVATTQEVGERAQQSLCLKRKRGDYQVHPTKMSKTGSTITCGNNDTEESSVSISDIVACVSAGDEESGNAIPNVSVNNASSAEEEIVHSVLSEVSVSGQNTLASETVSASTENINELSGKLDQVVDDNIASKENISPRNHIVDVSDASTDELSSLNQLVTENVSLKDEVSRLNQVVVDNVVLESKVIRLNKLVEDSLPTHFEASGLKQAAADNKALKAELSCFKEVVKQVANNNEKLKKELSHLRQVVDEHCALREKLSGLNEVESENLILKDQVSNLKKFSLTEENLKNDEKKLKFYTGLPTFTLLMHVFNLVSSAIPSSYRNALPKFSEFIMVLMRLRLGLLEQDLAYRFGVAQSTVSSIFDKWIRVMAGRLQDLIIWPERDVLHLTMPLCFKKQFGNSVCVIIDCFELFVDRAVSLKTRAETWSNYKQHNIVKFLIGITPQGTISFISNGWVGRASDQEITVASGFLDKLVRGDVVLADRGFNISEDVGMYQARLQIPAFTKGKTQLSSEVRDTRGIANVRIHVERVIGLLKRKFRLLRGTLPVSLVTPRVGDDSAPIDLIIRVCCTLINLCPSVVSSGVQDDNEEDENEI